MPQLTLRIVLPSAVRGSLGVSAVGVDREVQRLVITFPAYPEYEIASPETVTLTLPAVATKSNSRVFVTPAFMIRASVGDATLSGRALNRVTEADIRERGGEVTFGVTLSNDTFSQFVGHRHVDPIATEALLENVRSSTNEATGWNAVVAPRSLWLEPVL